MAKGALCVHCRKRKAYKSRGLCFPCFEDMAIRELYPAKHRSEMEYKKETMEDLDRLVQSQLPTMPTETHEPRESSAISPLEAKMVRWRYLR